MNLLMNVRTCFGALFLVLMATSVAGAQISQGLNCHGGFDATPVEITVKVGNDGSAVLKKNSEEVANKTTSGSSAVYTVCPSVTGLVLEMMPNSGFSFASLNLSVVTSSGLGNKTVTKDISSDVKCLAKTGCSYTFDAPSANVSFAASFGYRITDGVSGVEGVHNCRISGLPVSGAAPAGQEIRFKFVDCDEGFGMEPEIGEVDWKYDYKTDEYVFTMPEKAVEVAGYGKYALTLVDDVEDASSKLLADGNALTADGTVGSESDVSFAVSAIEGYEISEITYVYVMDGNTVEKAITFECKVPEGYTVEECYGGFDMPSSKTTIKVKRKKYRTITVIDDDKNTTITVYPTTHMGEEALSSKAFSAEDENITINAVAGNEVMLVSKFDKNVNNIVSANLFYMDVNNDGVVSEINMQASEDGEGTSVIGFVSMPDADVKINVIRGRLITIDPSLVAHCTVDGVPSVQVPKEKVSFTVNCNEGYYVTPNAKDADNKDLTITEKDGTYSFTMATTNVTLSGVYFYAVTMVRDDGASEFFIFKDDEDPEGREDDKAYEGEIISLQLLKEGKGETLSASYDTYIGSETPVTHAIDLTTAELDETGFYLIDFLMPAANVVINVVHSDIDYTISLDDVEDQCYATDFAVVGNYKDNIGFQVLCQDGYYAEVSLTCGTGDECPEVSHTGSSYGFVQPATDVTVVVRAKKNVPVVEESSSSSATVVVVESSSSSATVVAVESSSSSVVVVPAESSSSKANSSSSSAKFSSSSSKAESSSSSAKSSSSSSKAESSSSSAKSSSSSSKAESSSSSAKSSSSSKKDEKEFVVAQTQMPQFQMVVAGRNVALSGVRSGSTLTVFSLQGSVVMTAPINGSNFTFNLPHAGSYLVKVGSTMKQVSVR